MENRGTLGGASAAFSGASPHAAQAAPSANLKKQSSFFM
jgi:hypothetical protein